jgi:hypothetical protein
MCGKGKECTGKNELKGSLWSVPPVPESGLRYLHAFDTGDFMTANCNMDLRNGHFQH